MTDDTTKPPNRLEITDRHGNVVRVFDYDSGLYVNGLPLYTVPVGGSAVWYKDGQLRARMDNVDEISKQFAQCTTTDDVLALLHELTEAEHQRYTDAINAITDASIKRMDAIAMEAFGSSGEMQ